MVFDLKDNGQQRILARVVRRNQTEAGYLTAVQLSEIVLRWWKRKRRDQGDHRGRRGRVPVLIQSF